MDKTIEKFFNLVSEAYKDNPTRGPQIKTVVDSYDDEYRKKLIHIAKEADAEELAQIYSDSFKDGSLKEDGAISYVLALNPKLPKSIVNEICFVGIPDTSYQRALFEIHMKSISLATFAEIYREHSFFIRSGMVKSHYQRDFTREDINYPEWIINAIALKVFEQDEKSVSSYYTVDSDKSVFRYITDQKFVNDLINQIRNIPENKESVVTEILNNIFISEEKRNEIFDEFGCDFKNLAVPTPHMVDTIYRATVATVFESDMDRYSKKTEEESYAYRESIFILEKLASRGNLTSGMEYDLMKMLVDRKDRSSEMLTSELVRHTKDSRVLHLALGLKSTNDKDDAISNLHLSTEDIITVSKISKKKIDADLKKGYYASRKHKKRLANLCGRATLPDDVYDTMFKLNDSSVESKIVNSIYTPRHILLKALDRILSKTSTYYNNQELQAKCMLFCIDNCLSREKAQHLMNAILHDYTAINNTDAYSKQQRNKEIKDFICDNPDIEKYKQFLYDELPSLAENYQKSVTRVVDYIDSPLKLENEGTKQRTISDYTLYQINTEMSRIAYLNTSASPISRVRFYFDIKDNAEKYIELNAEKEKREREMEQETPAPTR